MVRLMFSDTEKENILRVKSKLTRLSTGFHFKYVFKPDRLLTSAFDSAFISGGAIGSLLRGEEPNDYDMYFQMDPFVDVKTFIELEKDNIMTTVEHYRNRGGNVLDDEKGTPLITENAITMKDKLQLIYKSYGTPDQIRKTFDYIHCMPYYSIGEDKLYISKEQYDLCIYKVLKINNRSSYSKYREEKFKKRGWV